METLHDENEHNNSAIDSSANKHIRSRFKRQTATDIIPLVEFYDTVSQPSTFDSTTE